MNNVIRKAISFKFAVLTTMAPLFLASSPASAAFRNTCEDVGISVENNTGKAINLIDLEYYNDRTGLWKNLFVRNYILDNGESKTYTNNLLKVKKVDTKIRAQYRTQKRGKWSWKVSETDSDLGTCAAGSQYSITLS